MIGRVCVLADGRAVVKIGAIRVDPLVDGTAFVGVDEAVSIPEGKFWDCHAHPLEANGTIRMDIGGFLVRHRNKVILVDAGGGPHVEPHTVTGALLVQLHQLGLSADDITDVFFTHMHWDHIGWSTQRGEITFRNATYHVHQDDWTYFMEGDEEENDPIRAIVAPVAERLETFTDEHDFVPGFRVRPAPGHTPGTTVYALESDGEHGMLLGDTIHTVGELTDPEWVGMWDIDPKAAQVMRAKLAAELAASGDPFAPAHFPDLTFGRFVTQDNLRKFSWLAEQGRS